MRAVMLVTTDGPKWVNPETISVLWALDGTTVRLHTPAGFMDTKGTPDGVVVALWGPAAAPAAQKVVTRGR